MAPRKHALDESAEDFLSHRLKKQKLEEATDDCKGCNDPTHAHDTQPAPPLIAPVKPPPKAKGCPKKGTAKKTSIIDPRPYKQRFEEVWFGKDPAPPLEAPPRAAALTKLPPAAAVPAKVEPVHSEHSYTWTYSPSRDQAIDPTSEPWLQFLDYIEFETGRDMCIQEEMDKRICGLYAKTIPDPLPHGFQWKWSTAQKESFVRIEKWIIEIDYTLPEKELEELSDGVAAWVGEVAARSRRARN